MDHILNILDDICGSISAGKSLKSFRLQKFELSQILSKTVPAEERVRRASILLEKLKSIFSNTRNNEDLLLQLLDKSSLLILQVSVLLSSLKDSLYPEKDSHRLLEELLEIINALCDGCPKVQALLVGSLSSEYIGYIIGINCPFVQKMEVIKSYNILLEDCPFSVKQELIQYKTFFEKLKQLFNLIFHVGDYEFQVGALECIFRLVPKKLRPCYASKFSQSTELISALLMIKDENFETDCRLFLNCLNKQMNEKRSVLSVPCIKAILGKRKLSKPDDPGYDDFWVDFNYGSKQIIIFCKRDSSNVYSQNAEYEDVWETIRIRDSDVNSYHCSENSKPIIVTVELKKHVRELFPQMVKAEGKELCLHFEDNWCISEAFRKTLGIEQQFGKKVSSVNEPLHLFMKNGSLQNSAACSQSLPQTNQNHMVKKISVPADPMTAPAKHTIIQAKALCCQVTPVSCTSNITKSVSPKLSVGKCSVNIHPISSCERITRDFKSPQPPQDKLKPKPKVKAPVVILGEPKPQNISKIQTPLQMNNCKEAEKESKNGKTVQKEKKPRRKSVMDDSGIGLNENDLLAGCTDQNLQQRKKGIQVEVFVDVHDTDDIKDKTHKDKSRRNRVKKSKEHKSKENKKNRPDGTNLRSKKYNHKCFSDSFSDSSDKESERNKNKYTKSNMKNYKSPPEKLIKEKATNKKTNFSSDVSLQNDNENNCLENNSDQIVYETQDFLIENLKDDVICSEQSRVSDSQTSTKNNKKLFTDKNPVNSVSQLNLTITDIETETIDKLKKDEQRKQAEKSTKSLNNSKPLKQANKLNEKDACDEQKLTEINKAKNSRNLSSLVSSEKSSTNKRCKYSSDSDNLNRYELHQEMSSSDNNIETNCKHSSNNKKINYDSNLNSLTDREKRTHTNNDSIKDMRYEKTSGIIAKSSEVKDRKGPKSCQLSKKSRDKQNYSKSNKIRMIDVTNVLQHKNKFASQQFKSPTDAEVFGKRTDRMHSPQILITDLHSKSKESSVNDKIKDNTGIKHAAKHKAKKDHHSDLEKNIAKNFTSPDSEASILPKRSNQREKEIESKSQRVLRKRKPSNKSLYVFDSPCSNISVEEITNKENVKPKAKFNKATGISPIKTVNTNAASKHQFSRLLHLSSFNTSSENSPDPYDFDAELRNNSQYSAQKPWKTSRIQIQSNARSKSTATYSHNILQQKSRKTKAGKQQTSEVTVTLNKWKSFSKEQKPFVSKDDNVDNFGFSVTNSQTVQNSATDISDHSQDCLLVGCRKMAMIQETCSQAGVHQTKRTETKLVEWTEHQNIQKKSPFQKLLLADTDENHQQKNSPEKDRSEIESPEKFVLEADECSNNDVLSNFSAACKSLLLESSLKESDQSNQNDVCNRSEVSWFTKKQKKKPNVKVYQKHNKVIENEDDLTFNSQELELYELSPAGPLNRSFINKSLTPKIPRSKKKYSPLDVKFIKTQKTPSIANFSDVDDEGTISESSDQQNNVKAQIINMLKNDHGEKIAFPVSGPSSTIRPNKSAMKRKYPNLDSFFPENDGDSSSSSELKNTSRLIPRKLFKNDDKENPGNVNIKSFDKAANELSLLKCQNDNDVSELDLTLPESSDLNLQKGVKSIFKTFSIDLQNQLKKKQHCLETITRNTLKFTHKSFSEKWKQQSEIRKRIMNTFNEKVIAELEILEKDIAALKSAEDQAVAFFKLQKKMFENHKVTQETGLTNLKQIHTTLNDDTKTAEENEKYLKNNISHVLKNEISELQRKLLLDTQKQQLENVRKCLFALMT